MTIHAVGLTWSACGPAGSIDKQFSLISQVCDMGDSPVVRTSAIGSNHVWCVWDIGLVRIIFFQPVMDFGLS